MTDEGAPQPPSGVKQMVDAATAICVTDGAEGIRVLLLRRAAHLSFAPGMWVFPGGKVDPADLEAAESDRERSLAIAACRETDEEAGISILPEDLVFWSHWTPPPESPSRFSTNFFLAPLPSELTPRLLDAEMDRWWWTSPAEALAARDAGEAGLTPPTWITLHELTQRNSVAELVAWAQSREPERYATRIHTLENGEVAALYHGDRLYNTTTEARELAASTGSDPSSGPHHRLTMGSTWTYRRDPCTVPRRVPDSDIALPPPHLLWSRPAGTRVAVDVFRYGDSEPTSTDVSDSERDASGTAAPQGRFEADPPSPLAETRPIDVVYFHGTPDCRLAVPPLTAEAAEGLNIRLVSFDRPGLGDSDPDEHSGPESVAEIVAELVDGLGLHNPVFLAWSAGALFALAAAARLGDRCGGLVLAAPLAPLSSLEDPSVAAVVGPDRTAFAEMAAEMGPDEAARTLAPYLVPYGASAELARQITAHVDNELDRAEVEATPGATEMLAAAIMGTMVTGMGGIERDLLASGSPVDFAAITCPTVVISAELDDRCPPAMADWIAGRIDGAIHETVKGRGHLFPLGDWAGLLRRAQELRG